MLYKLYNNLAVLTIICLCSIRKYTNGSFFVLFLFCSVFVCLFFLHHGYSLGISAQFDLLTRFNEVKRYLSSEVLLGGNCQRTTTTVMRWMTGTTVRTTLDIKKKTVKCKETPTKIKF